MAQSLLIQVHKFYFLCPSQHIFVKYTQHNRLHCLMKGDKSHKLQRQTKQSKNISAYTFYFNSQNKFANLTVLLVLYSNIQLQETIVIAINLILNDNSKPFSQDKLIFFLTVNVTTKLNGFMISSLLIPVLANIFMGYHKKKWLNEYNHSNHKFCLLRFADDILVAFNKE